MNLETVRDRTTELWRMEMDTNNIDTAKAYLEGMLWVAYGVKIISGSVAEWQIDKVKECAKKLKEAEIDHSTLTQIEKENLKYQWKQWIDATTQGFKEVLRREGKVEEQET